MSPLEVDRVARTKRRLVRQLVVHASLSALLMTGCAPAIVHFARPGEDPFDKITTLAVDSNGVVTRSVRDLPRGAYRHAFNRWPSAPTPAVPRAEKLHPRLREWARDSLPLKRVVVLITLQDPIRLPRFPEPRVEEPRTSPANVAALAAADSLIRRIRAGRDSLYRRPVGRITSSFGARVIEQFWITQAVLVEMPIGNVVPLSRLPEVVYVAPNHSGEPPPSCNFMGLRDDTPESARALLNSDPWAGAYPGGWITLLDTGVDTLHTSFIGLGPPQSHPQLAFVGNCVEPGWDCTSGNVTDVDPGGHGTSSAAILVGLPSPNGCERGITTAQVTSCRVYSTNSADCTIGCTVPCLARDAVLRGFQLSLYNLNQGILAEMQADGPENAEISAAADQAFNAGHIVIAPQGNSNGCTSCTATVSCLNLCRVKSPANAHYAIGVSGWDIKGPIQPGGAMCGPSQIGTRVKPDVLAPSSTWVAAHHMPDTWHGFTATSGAAPYAAAVALLLKRYLGVLPGMTLTTDPGQVYAALIATGRDTWTRQSNGTTQTDFNVARGAGPIQLPGWPLTGFFGKVAISGGSAFASVPINLTGLNVTRLEAALWWPEVITSATSTTPPIFTFGHADINLELVPPPPASPAVAWSRRASGVFERATAAVATTQLGIWQLVIQGNAIPTFPAPGQPVYYAVFAR